MSKKLTRKQDLFIAEYLVDMNATRAAIAAGYSRRTATEQGARLLVNVKVAAAIAEKVGQRMDKLEITSERILQKLAEMAFFDVRALFNPDGSPKDLKDLDKETAASIAGLDVCELFDGSQGDQRHVTGLVKKIRLVDRIRCLELLGKYKKLWTDKTENTTKVTLEDLVVAAREGL